MSASKQPTAKHGSGPQHPAELRESGSDGPRDHEGTGERHGVVTRIAVQRRSTARGRSNPPETENHPIAIASAYPLCSGNLEAAARANLDECTQVGSSRRSSSSRPETSAPNSKHPQASSECDARVQSAGCQPPSTRVPPLGRANGDGMSSLRS